MRAKTNARLRCGIRHAAHIPLEGVEIDHQRRGVDLGEWHSRMGGRKNHGCATALGKMAERVGFEPTLRFPVNTLSKRAPSATRPPLRIEPALRVTSFYINAMRAFATRS